MGATAALMVGQTASAYGQGEASKAQGQYQKSMADINARNMDLAAEDALKRGDKEASSYMKKVEKTVGSQRAALAAQGIDVSSGDSLSIVEETRQIGADDALTIKNNAFREAMGYRAKASSDRAGGQMASLAAESSARNTLIGGGLQSLNTGLANYRGVKAK